MEQSEELKDLKDALEILEYHYSEYAGVLRKIKRRIEELEKQFPV